MTEKEFEHLWQENRQRLLNANKEWRETQESYKMTSGADWLLFGIPLMTGIVSMQYVPVEHELLKWLLSAVITVVCFALCVWVKSLTSGTRPVSEIEQEVKEQFRDRCFGPEEDAS